MRSQFGVPYVHGFFCDSLLEYFSSDTRSDSWLEMLFFSYFFSRWPLIGWYSFWIFPYSQLGKGGQWLPVASARHLGNGGQWLPVASG